MQGITTRYIGPSNVRGSRIKALARKADTRNNFKEMSLTVPYGHGNTDEEHAKAAKALAEKLGWGGVWFAGGKPEEDGNMYVNIGRADPLLIDPLTRRGVEGRDWFVAVA